MKHVMAVAVLLLLAGCGVYGQRTPEPDERDRLDRLIDELGTQRSYNSRTLLMNPEPEGLILGGWIDRRRQTLDGTLPLSRIPAVENPGSVAATLKWERDARKTEAARGDAYSMHYTNYFQSAEDRARNCPGQWKTEATWWAAQRKKHMTTVGGVDVDWDEANTRFQARCDEEIAARDAQEKSRMEAHAAARERASAELELARQACEARLTALQRATGWNDPPSRAAAVAEEYRVCMDSVQARWQAYAEQDDGEGGM